MDSNVEFAGCLLILATLWNIHICSRRHAGRTQSAGLVKCQQTPSHVSVVASAQWAIHPFEDLSSSIKATIADKGRLATNLARGIAWSVKVCRESVPSSWSCDELNKKRVAEESELFIELIHWT